jgi:hypothetical protein
MSKKDLELEKKELLEIWADHPEESGENWLDNFFIDVIKWHSAEVVRVLESLKKNHYFDDKPIGRKLIDCKIQQAIKEEGGEQR